MSTGAPAAMRITAIPPCPLCGETGCDRITVQHQQETVEEHLRAKYIAADAKRARYKAFLEVLIQEVDRAMEMPGLGPESAARIAKGLAETALNV